MINSAYVLNQLSLTLGDPYAQHYISGCWRLLQRQVSEDKCMRCEGGDMNQYVGQKYRVIGHILKTHLTLTDVPYYCSLCLFRCQEWNDLIKHVHIKSSEAKWSPEDDGQEKKHIERLINLLSSWWKEQTSENFHERMPSTNRFRNRRPVFQLLVLFLWLRVHTPWFHL
jgi:hypothetical protein